MDLIPKTEKDFDLKEIREAVKKRKWFLIAFVLTITLGTALYCFFAKPVYEAKARVLVNLKKPDPVKLTNNITYDFKGKEFFETQVALIKSRTLIRNVIKKLKLDESPEFQSDDLILLTDLRSKFQSLLIGLGLKDNSPEAVSVDPYSLLIDKITNRLAVRQLKSSRVLEISFQGRYPQLVAEITNSLTQEYMAKVREWYNVSDESTAAWMEIKLRDLDSKLKNSERKIREFKQKRNFIESKDGTDLVSKKWSEISQELTKAASERLHLETQIKELKALKNEPVKLLLSQPFLFNSNLSELQKKYIDLNNELNALLKSKTSQHPDVVLLKNKLHLLNQSIPFEVDNFLSSLAIKLKAAINKEKTLERILEKQQKAIMKTNNDFQQFRFLKQEVELNEKLYNEILNRKKELEVTSNFNPSNISIVDYAEVPYIPVKPKKGMYVTTAFVLSIFMGFVLIFYQESQDKAINTETDLDDHTPYFVWGSIARIPKRNLSSHFADPKEFRSLLTQFLLKSKDSSNKIFLITSPKSEEGKTFVSSNLAIYLGNLGKKVLIVDCDFYTSKIASVFNVDKKYGYLNGLDNFNKVFHETSFKNVWVVPPGEETLKTASTSNVFFSEPFQNFLKEAEARWDYILIKAPPVLAAPDAKVLERYSHGVILVLQSGAYDPVSVRKVFNQLDSGKLKQKPTNNGKSFIRKPAKLMGVAINKMDRKYKEIEYRYYQNRE